MTNNKSQKILEDDYSRDVSEVVDYIVLYNEQRKALDLLKILQRAVNDNKEALRQQPRLFKFYQEEISKLKFICLANLEVGEILDLIKNNFCLQFSLLNYDLIDKLNAALVGIILVDDRNKLKSDLRKIILENTEKIVINHNIKSIKDWLKNYVSVVGIDGTNKLARIQYLVSLKNDKSINQTEYSNLQILFKFYDYLSIPSDSPGGMEEECPVVVGGKLFIFRKGILEPVTNNKNVDEAVRLLGVKDELAPQAIDVGRDNVKEMSVYDTLLLQLSDLEQALKNYPSDSLEHKAIKQEINRLKVAAFKQAQKTNVKK